MKADNLKTVPFFDIGQPAKTLLINEFALLKRPLKKIIQHVRSYEHERIVPFLKVIKQTPSGLVDLFITQKTIEGLKVSGVSMRLAFSKDIDFFKETVVLRTMALPDTVLAKCEGMRLCDVADPGLSFPGRDAVITNARRVIRTTRLIIDAPVIELSSEEFGL